MTLVESTRSDQVASSPELVEHQQTMKQVAKDVAQRPTPPAILDLSWRIDASCRDTSPEIFFPIGSTGRAINQIERAREVCMTCPARQACLEYALITNQDSGVWGATSEEDRKSLRQNYIRN